MIYVGPYPNRIHLRVIDEEQPNKFYIRDEARTQHISGRRVFVRWNKVDYDLQPPEQLYSVIECLRAKGAEVQAVPFESDEKLPFILARSFFPEFDFLDKEVDPLQAEIGLLADLDRMATAPERFTKASMASRMADAAAAIRRRDRLLASDGEKSR